MTKICFLSMVNGKEMLQECIGQRCSAYSSYNDGKNEMGFCLVTSVGTMIAAALGRGGV